MLRKVEGEGAASQNVTKTRTNLHGSVLKSVTGLPSALENFLEHRYDDSEQPSAVLVGGSTGVL